MSTPLKQSLFVIVVLTIAVVLVVISVMTDFHGGPVHLTYDEEDEYFLNEWKEAGGGDFGTWGLPESVLKQFDITERSISPEVFFSNEFQNALFSSLEPFSIMTDPLEHVSRVESSFAGDSEVPFSVENEKRKMAAISRLRSLDDLPPDVIAGIEMQRDHLRRMNSIQSEGKRQLPEAEWYSIIPIDQAFSQLQPEDQKLLLPYRERMNDFISILKLESEMSTEAREASQRLLVHMQKREVDVSALSPSVRTPLPSNVVPVQRMAPNSLSIPVSVRRTIARSFDRSLSARFSDEMGCTTILAVI